MPNFLTADFFAPLAADHRLIAYFIIFAAMIIEGEGALLFFSFLAQRGMLDFGDVLIFAGLGALTGDLLWYLAGDFWGSGILAKKHWFLSRVEEIREFLRRNHYAAIFFSKFLYGFGHSVMFLSGTMKSEFELRRVLFWMFLSVASWTLAIGFLGYFLGATISGLGHFIAEASAIFVFFVLLAVLSRRILNRYL